MLIIDGKPIMRDYNGAAAEIGHLPIVEECVRILYNCG